MGIISDQREKVAAVVGAKLANEIQDRQLPAILHAIDGDENEVRFCARRASQDGVSDPPTLLLWLIRTHAHTGLLPDPDPESKAISISPPSDEEVEERKALSGEWKRIQRACMRSQDFKDLYDEYCRMNPNPSNETAATIRAELIDVLNEMNAQKEARA